MSGFRRTIERPFIVVCSYCGILKKPSAWPSIEMLPPSARVSHGICDGCWRTRVVPEWFGGESEPVELSVVAW